MSHIRIQTVELLAKEGEKHGEVDGPRRIANHVLQHVVIRRLACGKSHCDDDVELGAVTMGYSDRD